MAAVAARKGEMQTKIAVSLHTEKKAIKTNEALLEVFVCL